MKHFMAD